ncbi:MAG: deoxyhypusine synthase family protein [Deltaproteobacteria bacterium]|nr:MAG: deoxyhypusine synthase family protein [Deltaproteobacteria bacterium]
MDTKSRRNSAEFGDGLEDRLEPLESLDLKTVDDLDQMLAQMAKTSFTGRRLGEAAEVLTEMVSDPDCQVVATFSGAMTVAKMGLVICDMIDWGWLDVIISTGALMAHGFVEAAGMVHFKHENRLDDVALYRRGYNRVYDTLELEKNLDRTERIISEILDRMDQSKPFGSEIFCRELGQWLVEHTDQPGILRNAYLKGIPVYVPAFTDSELALDMATWMVSRVMAGDAEISVNQAFKQVSGSFNPFLDLMSYSQRVLEAKRVGIFTIGGGVPRNWAQQVSPFLEILQERCDRSLPLRKFHYGVRICPEPVHWGGLSGCTYSEGISWGKFVAPQEGGRFAEVLCDATVAWPFLVKAVRQRLDKTAKRGG